MSRFKFSIQFQQFEPGHAVFGDTFLVNKQEKTPICGSIVTLNE